MDTENVETRYRMLLVFGIIGPVIAISFTILDVFISPWFSWYTNALSDLGVHPYSFLFNGGLLVEAGANLIFAIALRKMNYATGAVSAMLAIAGLSLGLVGIFNEHYSLYHLTFALIYFIVFPIAIVIFSSSRTLKSGYSRGVGYFCSIVGLAFILVGILQDFNLFSTGLGLGVYEFVEAFLLSVWTVYTGAFYLTAVSKTYMGQEAVDEKS